MKITVIVGVLAFVTAAIVIQGQQNPADALNAARAWQALSANDLAVAKTYQLASLSGGPTPASAINSAAPWGALSDRDLSILQTYFLSQLAGSGNFSGIPVDFVNTNTINSGLRGNPSYPFSTPSNALATAQSGDLFSMSGYYLINTNTVLPPFSMLTGGTGILAGDTLLGSGLILSNGVAVGANFVLSNQSSAFSPIDAFPVAPGSGYSYLSLASCTFTGALGGAYFWESGGLGSASSYSTNLVAAIGSNLSIGGWSRSFQLQEFVCGGAFHVSGTCAGIIWRLLRWVLPKRLLHQCLFLLPFLSGRKRDC